MSEFTDKDFDRVVAELELIWAAHQAHGLDGKMCLYTPAEQVPWRSKEPSIKIWFGPDETFDAVRKLRHYYNDGNLPNSSPLLNPLVHEINESGSYEPVASGIS